MLRIEHEINIYKYQKKGTRSKPYLIQYFTSVMINEDNDSYTTTADIVLPFKRQVISDYELKNNELIYDLDVTTTIKFNIGDRIDIQLFFSPITGNGVVRDNKKQFVGYIASFELTKDNDIIIHCEDVMWLFKQFKVKFSYSDLLNRTAKNKRKDNPTARQDESAPTGFIPEQYLTEQVSLLSILIYLIAEMKDRLNRLSNPYKDKFEYDEQYDKYDTSLLLSFDPSADVTIPYAPDINLGKIRINEYVTPVEIFDYIKQNFHVNVFTRNVYSVDSVTGKLDTYQMMYGGTKYPIINNYDRRILERKYSNEILVASEGILTGYNPNLDSSIKNSTLNKATDLIVMITSTKDNSNKPVKIATIDGSTLLTDDPSINKALSERNYKVSYNIPNMVEDTIKKNVLDKWNNFEDSSFEGTVEILGLPIVRQGDHVKFSPVENNSDIYLVKSVQTLCDASNGFIQRIGFFNKLN